ncbi:hypothetical protein Tco_0548648 [Tanacetum coccineum]
MTRSSTKELLSPLENPKRVFRSRRKLFDNPSLVETSSPESEQLSEIEEHIDEEVTETMAETIEQYMSKTRENYGTGITAASDSNGTQTHPRLPHLYLTKQNSNEHAKIELSTELIMKLRNNAFDGTKTNNAVDHITRFLQIIDLVNTPNVNNEQLRVLIFPYSLTGEAHQWWVHEGNSKITSWVEIVDKFFYKYYPLSRACRSNNTNDKECHSKFMNWLSLKFKNP